MRLNLISEVLAAQVRLLQYFCLNVGELLQHLLEYVFFQAQRVQLCPRLERVQAVSLEYNIVLADHMADIKDAIGVDAQHFALDVEENLTRFLPPLKNDIVLVEPHRFKLLQVVQIESVRAVLEEWHPFDGVAVQKALELNLEGRRQYVEKVAHVLLGLAAHAHVLLEVDEEPLDQIWPDVELFVKLVHLSYSLLVDLARASKLGEERRQFAKKGHKDTHSKDYDGQDPAQFKPTRLRDVAIPHRSYRYNRPIHRTHPLGRQRLIIQAIS